MGKKRKEKKTLKTPGMLSRLDTFFFQKGHKMMKKFPTKTRNKKNHMHKTQE